MNTNTNHRTETRRERYLSKSAVSSKLPFSFVSINFQIDDNLAFLVRTAACYGACCIHVIGSVPERKYLQPKSGSLIDFVELIQYPNPSAFLAHARENNIEIVTAEICENSTSLYDYKFNFDRQTAIVLGNEFTGVPAEFMLRTNIVHIPMMGVGYSMNTSQTGTAFATEYVRQYLKRG